MKIVREIMKLGKFSRISGGMVCGAQSKLRLCSANRPVSQMRALLAACRKLAVDYDTFPKLLYVFGLKT